MTLIPFKNYKDVSAVYIFADIRGFSKWAKEYPSEINKLLEITYSLAKDFFDQNRNIKLKKKLVKFLGDGFFAVNEFDPKDNSTFSTAVSDSINNILDFIDNFNTHVLRSQIHSRYALGIGFGVSYGYGYRFNLPGFSTDYVGVQVNIAARLCQKADSSEVIFEYDLYNYLQEILQNRFHQLISKDEFLDFKEVKNFRVYRVTDVYQLLRKSSEYDRLERFIQEYEKSKAQNNT